MSASTHRRAAPTLAGLAPWWLLFVALLLCVGLHQKSFDVSVGVVSDDHPTQHPRSGEVNLVP
jgi:hypothetical protein